MFTDTFPEPDAWPPEYVAVSVSVAVVIVDPAVKFAVAVAESPGLRATDVGVGGWQVSVAGHDSLRFRVPALVPVFLILNSAVPLAFCVALTDVGVAATVTANAGSG
jgi:hypothetical protein